MAKAYFKQMGDTLDYANNTDKDINYGDVVVLTGRIGIAESDIPINGLGSLSVSGVYELPATTSEDITLGQQVYWDAENSRVTGTAEGNIPCGFAVSAKASANSVIGVKID